MRFLLILFIVIGQVLAYSPANAADLDDSRKETCVNLLDNQTCIDSPLIGPLEPIIKPLLPGNGAPAPTTPPKSSGGSGGSKNTHKTTRPQVRAQNTQNRQGAVKPAEKDKKKKDKVKPTPSPSPTPTIEVRTKYVERDYPWPFWATLVFAISSISFMVYYTADKTVAKRNKRKHKA